MSELTHNQVRGYKSTLHNPRVSDEAKDHAQAVLDGEATPNDLHQPKFDEHTNRHLGGKKATISNPYTSKEAKDAAARELEEAYGDSHYSHPTTTTKLTHKQEVHQHRVLGGYKAALKNPHVSEEAKEHALEVLEKNDAF